MNTAQSEHGQPKGQTPKQRLMQWIRSKLPSDVPVTNFTSDWNDGTALGALVDALVPGACDNWRQWRPDDALENTKKAMQAAENLGIGRVSCLFALGCPVSLFLSVDNSRRVDQSKRRREVCYDIPVSVSTCQGSSKGQNLRRQS